MAETSFPMRDTPMSDEEWKLVTRGIGDGVLDAGGGPYRITNLNNATNQITVSAASTSGVAQAILCGFYHRLDAPAILDVPAVTSSQTYHVVLEYSPLRVESGEAPVQLKVVKSLDYTSGRQYLVLHRIHRKANQLLTDASRRELRPRIAPSIFVNNMEEIPDADQVLLGSVAVVRSPADVVAVVDSGGTRSWVSLLSPSWEPVEYMPSYVAASHGHAPKIKRQGATRSLRGRMSRLGGGNFLPSQSSGYTILTIPAGDRPSATQAWPVAITGMRTPSFARVELSSSGTLRVYVERETPWVGLDGVSWDVD